MDDALRAYDAGRSDGIAGVHDDALAADRATGADYRTGLSDGQLAAFESRLLDAIRDALGDGG